jgi:hypothetical protein
MDTPCNGTEGSSCNKNNNCIYPKCKMKSKAEQLAEERYPKPSFNIATKIGESKILERERAAFIAGLQVGMEFAEWLYQNRWFHLSDNGKWNYTFEHGTAMSDKTYNKNYRKTTEQLFEIFLNEKHDTTTH